jgi:hypothetical protein
VENCIAQSEGSLNDQVIATITFCFTVFVVHQEVLSVLLGPLLQGRYTSNLKITPSTPHLHFLPLPSAASEFWVIFTTLSQAQSLVVALHMSGFLFSSVLPPNTLMGRSFLSSIGGKISSPNTDPPCPHYPKYHLPLS